MKFCCIIVVYFKFWFQYNQAVAWLNPIQLFVSISAERTKLPTKSQCIFPPSLSIFIHSAVCTSFRCNLFAEDGFFHGLLFQHQLMVRNSVSMRQNKMDCVLFGNTIYFRMRTKRAYQMKKKHNDNQTTITKHIVNQNYNEREQTARCRNRQMSIRFHPWVRQMCVYNVSWILNMGVHNHVFVYLIHC